MKNQPYKNMMRKEEDTNPKANNTRSKSIGEYQAQPHQEWIDIGRNKHGP